MPMNNPDWENLMRKVRNALATLQCNLPETDKEIVQEIQKIYEMIR